MISCKACSPAESRARGPTRAGQRPAMKPKDCKQLPGSSKQRPSCGNGKWRRRRCQRSWRRRLWKRVTEKKGKLQREARKWKLLRRLLGRENGAEKMWPNKIKQQTWCHSQCQCRRRWRWRWLAMSIPMQSARESIVCWHFYQHPWSGACIGIS